MRALLPFLLALGVGGCSKTTTGDALIATGAVVAVVASEVATGGTCVPQEGTDYPAEVPCHGSTGNKKAQTAAGIGVATGIALAAVGQTLKERDRGDSQKPRATYPTASWQLESAESEEAEEAAAQEEAPAEEENAGEN